VPPIAPAAARPLVDHDIADKIRIDVAALLGAGIAAIDVQRLLRPIDLDRDPALPLYAADVDVQAAAIAAIARLHARKALEQIGRRHHAEASDVDRRHIDGRARRQVDISDRVR